MYRYEIHLHTSPVSRCARVNVEDSLKFYKDRGYDGVFITNHFPNERLEFYNVMTYEEQMRYHFSDYFLGAELSNKIGIKVFCGTEMSFLGTDFLVFGLDMDWYIDHPEIMTMHASERLAYLRENGAFIIHAHPFRERAAIDHFRLFPRLVDGVEIHNAKGDENENDMALSYAEHYGLIHFAGSDNHHGGRTIHLGGVESETPVADVFDFISQAKAGKLKPFTDINQNGDK